MLMAPQPRPHEPPDHHLWRHPLPGPRLLLVRDGDNGEGFGLGEVDVGAEEGGALAAEEAAGGHDWPSPRASEMASPSRATCAANFAATSSGEVG